MLLLNVDILAGNAAQQRLLIAICHVRLYQGSQTHIAQSAK